MSIKLKKNIIEDYGLAFLCCISCILLTYINNTLYKTLIVLFCIVAVITCIRRKKIKKSKLVFVRNWSFFVLWAALSTIWSYKHSNINIMLTLLLIGATCFSINVYLDSVNDIYIYFNMIILSAIILEIYLFNYYGIAIFNSRFNNDVLNSNRAGTIMALALLLAIYLWNQKKKKQYLISAFFLIIGTLLSGSKSSILFCVISVGMFLGLKNKTNFVKSLRNIILIFVLLIIIYQLITKVPSLYNIIGRRLLDFLGIFFGKSIANSSTQERQYLIRTGIEFFKEKPLIGWGIDNYRYMNSYKTYAHSNLVELLVDVGLVGTILFLRIYYITLKEIRKNINISDVDKAFAFSYMAGMLLINFTGVYFNDMIDIIFACLLFTFVTTAGRNIYDKSNIL